MDPILSVHIPKTAGTSLLHSYACITPPEKILLDYELETFPATRRLGFSTEGAAERAAKRLLKRLGLLGVASRLRHRLRARARAEGDPMEGIEIVHGHLRIRNYLERDMRGVDG